MKKKSDRKQLLVASAAALAVCTLFHLLDRPESQTDRAPELVASLERIERRLDDVEHQVELATRARVEPAVVTRVAEQHGFQSDEAWDAYFDGLESRLDQLEKRLEVGPGFADAETFTAAQFVPQSGNGTFDANGVLQPWVGESWPVGSGDGAATANNANLWFGATLIGSRRGVLQITDSTASLVAFKHGAARQPRVVQLPRTIATANGDDSTREGDPPAPEPDEGDHQE